MASHQLETEDLLVFLAVVRAGSMGAAASELHLATPSVSSRMTALERRLRARLFVRSTRGSSLTPAGERLVPYARRALALLQDAHSAVSSEERRRFVVAAPASLGTVVFPVVLDLLQDLDLPVHCRVAHSEEIMDYLLDGTVDAALLMNQMTPASIVVSHLRSSRLVALARPGHPLAARASVSVDDLLGEPMGIYRWNQDAEALASRFGDVRGRRERPLRMAGLPSTLLDLAAERGYVVVVPEFAAIGSLQEGRLVELAVEFPGWSLDVQLAHRRETGHSTGVTALRAGHGEIVRALTGPPVGDPHLGALLDRAHDVRGGR